MRPTVCGGGDDIGGVFTVSGADLGAIAGVRVHSGRYRRMVQARSVGKVGPGACVRVEGALHVALTPNLALNRTGRHSASGNRASARPAG